MNALQSQYTFFLFNGCTYTLCEYGTGWSGGDTGGVTLYKLQYNVCIDTWSLRHLTSAEEYPDEEYLDMSKSSSLKGSQREKMRVWKGKWYTCTAQCSTFIKSLMNIYRPQSDRDSKNSLNLHFSWCNPQALDNPDGIIRVIFLNLKNLLNKSFYNCFHRLNAAACDEWTYHWCGDLLKKTAESRQRS